MFTNCVERCFGPPREAVDGWFQPVLVMIDGLWAKWSLVRTMGSGLLHSRGWAMWPRSDRLLGVTFMYFEFFLATIIKYTYGQRNFGPLLSAAILASWHALMHCSCAVLQGTT